MSSDRNSPPLPSPPLADRRRASITGSTFAELFSRSPPSTSSSHYPGPITSAAAQAQRRRLSLTTVGLSPTQGQTSPFGTARSRGESISSANSASVDESPFEDGDAPAPANPSTAFGRRLSFGARALRDVRTGGSSGNGNGNGEGFSFAENLRSRAERTSISGVSGHHPAPPNPNHQRAKSVAIMEPPVKEVPRTPKVPDAFQERILKGDFYMD
ncbi:hypothetical protein M501DRAFT_1005688 [Patellaria atrata CBS 101060]|uniref:Uncharacterized protein n=1 Tax=Patellaria atrata CBS 101060 TaxID=1346257 RepID=A0A9P4SIP1_9PEZI|nr:hypothetical protein M501DRAFT_1005688 [Patellaria atrata CBS 101060]